MKKIIATWRTITGLTLLFISASIFASSAAGAKPKPSKVEPLTYTKLVAHFKAARLRATEVQKRCTVFFEGEWSSANIYNYGLIIVENSDEDLQVTFYLTDAHERNWITEFLDAPFFAPAETQRLFNLMNSDRQVRGQKVGRFRVDYHQWNPRHAEIIVFSFTPMRQT